MTAGLLGALPSLIPVGVAVITVPIALWVTRKDRRNT